MTKFAFDKIAAGLRDARRIAALTAASGHTEQDAALILEALWDAGWVLVSIAPLEAAHAPSAPSDGISEPGGAEGPCSPAVGLAHLIPQRRPHAPAFLVGDRGALTRIRDAITAALETGEGSCSVFASDGEGYGVHVLCVTDMEGVPFGYTDTEMCGEPGPWTPAMVRINQP
jgi:hypothetical protein